MENPATPSQLPSEHQMLSSRIALRGAIGLALEKALEDVQNESVHNQQDDGGSNSAPNLESAAEPLRIEPHPVITPTTLHYIQSCYGTIVANTDWRVAPSAVIKGRLDHYNRFQGQWRIVVDALAEIGPRSRETATASNNHKKGNADRSRSTSDVIQTMKLNEKVQILVFNDL